MSEFYFSEYVCPYCDAFITEITKDARLVKCGCGEALTLISTRELQEQE